MLCRIQGKPSAQPSRTYHLEEAEHSKPGSEAASQSREPLAGTGMEGGPQQPQAEMSPGGAHFPLPSPPAHPRNLGSDMLSRLQNLSQSLAAGGMEADGCIRVPNDLAYAVEKTRKPVKNEKSSGRVECEYLHNFAELWELWGADLLRPVVLFWKIPLPPWV